MSVKDYLGTKVGQRVGIVRSGFPKEIFHTGKLLRVESDVVILEDDKGREWAVPLDKVLLVGPPDIEEGDRPAGFRGGR